MIASSYIATPTLYPNLPSFLKTGHDTYITNSFPTNDGFRKRKYIWSWQRVGRIAGGNEGKRNEASHPDGPDNVEIISILNPDIGNTKEPLTLFDTPFIKCFLFLRDFLACTYQQRLVWWIVDSSPSVLQNLVAFRSQMDERWENRQHEIKPGKTKRWQKQVQGRLGERLLAPNKRDHRLFCTTYTTDD